jgi:Ca2+-binding EF-hand superfamily protein
MKLGRNRIAFILLGLVLAASFLFAQAKKSADQSKRPVYVDQATWVGLEGAQLLREIDADHDGVITHEEWERFFRDHDENKDGRLTANEIAPTQTTGTKEESSEALGPDIGRLKAFDRLDVNKDDVIERNEWPGNDRSFKRMDANRDGVLSREEFLSRNGRYWNESFENLDFDRNGVITRAEWLDSEAAFQRLDHDRNGVIDRFEFYTPR